jgi:hypothetical protein
MPQRAKTRRNASCTWGTGAADQYRWGENDALQHRAGGPIDEAQPAGQAPVAEPDLVGGVHLPGLVGLLGPRRARLLPGGFGQADRRARQDALDGADRRQVAEAQARQPAAQERRAPAGVVGAQAEDGLPECVGDGAVPAAPGIVGGCIDLTGAEQVADGADGQGEVEGDLAGGLALLVAAADGLTDGGGGGSWHGGLLGCHRTTSLNLTAPPGRGETFRRPRRRNFLSPATAKPNVA